MPIRRQQVPVHVGQVRVGDDDIRGQPAAVSQPDPRRVRPIYLDLRDFFVEHEINPGLAGDLDAYGEVMVQNNECQRSLHSGLISEEADTVIDIAKKYRAVGWKVNGAGGKGGSLTILGNKDNKLSESMLEEINSLGKGIRSIPISLARFGVTVQVEGP